MSRFREEVSLIPAAARMVAALLWSGLASLFFFLVLQRASDALTWPLFGRILLAAAVPLPLTIYALLVGYVYGDARRRGMRHVLWTWLAALIPNGIGIILYFLLRDPLLVHCVSCGAPARANFAFCPVCGAALGAACPQCRRAVEPAWANCAYCGTKL